MSALNQVQFLLMICAFKGLLALLDPTDGVGVAFCAQLAAAEYTSASEINIINLLAVAVLVLPQDHFDAFPSQFGARPFQIFRILKQLPFDLEGYVLP
jgi:hypothetical protein